MSIKGERSVFLFGGLVLGLLSLASEGKAAGTVTPPSPLAGNSNYWITAADPSGNTGAPITGFNVSIAVREDLHIANGMSIQLNGWSAPTSNIVWQQYGFSVTPPTLGWGIENWPTSAYGASLGMPDGGSLNFPGSLAPNLPNFPYGSGIVPAGYILDLVFHDDAQGNITGMTYTVTDICGKKSSIGPVNIVGTTLEPSGAKGTIPASALAPMYGVQLNLVNMPGGPFEFTSGSGTITYSANEPLYVSNHQPSWTSAQGIVTGENSYVAYNELPAGPSKIIVQDFGLAQCECSGTSCELPPGSFSGSCSGCSSTASGSGCQLKCDTCGMFSGTKANSTVQIPCAGKLTNGAVSNNNGDLSVQCTFQAPANGGVKTSIDPKCAAGSCTTPQGAYLTSCTGCAAVSSASGCTLGCTSCTKTDGTENATPDLTLPCSKSIENNNGVLQCGDTASGTGGSSGQGGASGSGGAAAGQGGASTSTGGASTSTGGTVSSVGSSGGTVSIAGSAGTAHAGSSGATATSGGGSGKAGSSSSGSTDSSGCSCKLAGAPGGSSGRSIALLALAGLLSASRKRSRSSARSRRTR